MTLLTSPTRLHDPLLSRHSMIPVHASLIWSHGHHSFPIWGCCKATRPSTRVWASLLYYVGYKKKKILRYKNLTVGTYRLWAVLCATTCRQKLMFWICMPGCGYLECFLSTAIVGAETHSTFPPWYCIFGSAFMNKCVLQGPVLASNPKWP